MANLVNTIRGMFAPIVEEKKIVNEAPEDKEPASPDEAKMAMKQLEFIEYAADELKDHIKSGKEFPEWMQNKLSKLHGQMESLHSAMGEHGEEETEIEEGYVVKYHTAKGEHKNTSKVFDNEAAAKSHAARGNSVDKVGGKYTVHKIGSKGHEVKEEVDEAKQPHKFGDTWKSYDAIKKVFHRGFDKKDWTPDEVASVKKHVKIAGRKERGLHPGTGPMDFSAGAMHDHIVKHAKSVKEEVEIEEAAKPTVDQISKVLDGAKDTKQGLAALMKAFKVDEKGAKAMLQKALGEEADLEEGWDEMMKAVKDRAKPQPNGGAGKKAGRAYGGANQKDDKKQQAEALSPKQKQLDVDKDGKIEKSDLEKLRKAKKPGTSGKAEPVEVNPKVEEGLKPGWMLKKDPELAKKVKAKQELAKKRQASYGDKSAGKSIGEETDFLNELLKGSKMTDFKEEVELDEAVKTGNEGRGYHGEHPSEKADAAYSKAHATVKKVAGEAGHLRDVKKPNVMVKHYLDSQHGRHLKGNETNHEYISKDFARFKKTYKPEMHESVEQVEGAMTDAEMKKREEIVKSMKKKTADFKSRYGDRWKSVMYATATKMANK